MLPNPIALKAIQPHKFMSKAPLLFLLSSRHAFTTAYSTFLLIYTSQMLHSQLSSLKCPFLIQSSCSQLIPHYQPPYSSIPNPLPSFLHRFINMLISSRFQVCQNPPPSLYGYCLNLTIFISHLVSCSNLPNALCSDSCPAEIHCLHKRQSENSGEIGPHAFPDSKLSSLCPFTLNGIHTPYSVCRVLPNSLTLVPAKVFIVPSAFGHTGLVVHQRHQAYSLLCSLSCCHFVSLNIVHLYLHVAHLSLHLSLFSVASALRSLPKPRSAPFSQIHHYSLLQHIISFWNPSESIWFFFKLSYLSPAIWV